MSQQKPRGRNPLAGGHSNDPYGQHRGGKESHPKAIICKCNNVSRSTIEEAIREGADTLNKIFDATMAGVGPCGGSCRRKLGPMLDHYLETGTFPEVIKEDKRGKR